MATFRFDEVHVKVVTGGEAPAARATAVGLLAR